MKLDRATSVYLNGIRFFAALVVFIGHVSGKRFTDGLFWQAAAFMDMAVMVFFVMSGFVIAYVVDSHEKDLRSYAINRVARIYSVALPALVLTFALDHLGMALRPNNYSAAWGFSHNDWLQYIASATFTHRLWDHEIGPGSNLPYWSLGYEVWYYILFGVLFFMRGLPRIILGLFAAFVAGPTILQLFPVWLMGVATYHITKAQAVPKWAGVAIIASTVIILAVLVRLDLQHTLDIPDTTLIRHVQGAVFSLNIVAFMSLRLSLKAGGRFEKYVDWFAGMTFSLYLFHLPTAQFLTTIAPWPPQSAFTAVFIFGGTFVLVLLLAGITERKKNAWRSWVTTLFDKVSGSDALLRKPA